MPQNFQVLGNLPVSTAADFYRCFNIRFGRNCLVEPRYVGAVDATVSVPKHWPAVEISRAKKYFEGWADCACVCSQRILQAGRAAENAVSV